MPRQALAEQKNETRPDTSGADGSAHSCCCVVASGLAPSWPHDSGCRGQLRCWGRVQVQLGPGGAEKVEGLGRLNDYERESLEVRPPCRSYLRLMEPASAAASTPETQGLEKRQAVLCVLSRGPRRSKGDPCSRCFQFVCCDTATQRVACVCLSRKECYGLHAVTITR